MKGYLPDWFTQRPSDHRAMREMEVLLNHLRLNTICESALCPNIGKCFSEGTATFLILGTICTRNCTFCAVSKGIPEPVDEDEPHHLLEAVERLHLNYVVITCVTRDDLPDGGASQFIRTIDLLHRSDRNLRVEVLVPDFGGSLSALRSVADSLPEVLSHNIETVPNLYPEVRPLADYERSIVLLSDVKKGDPGIVTKSGLMLGLGESRQEVVQVMRDLREAGCDLLTLGQYLSPSSAHYPVIRFVPPEEFGEYAKTAYEIGFAGVAASPLVRSSFQAAELYDRARKAETVITDRGVISDRLKA